MEARNERTGERREEADSFRIALNNSSHLGACFSGHEWTFTERTFPDPFSGRRYRVWRCARCEQDQATMILDNGGAWPPAGLV